MTNLPDFYSDLDEEGFGKFKIPRGKPFRSLVQLLSVLPPSSQALLPSPYRQLMRETSPLSEYYPASFETDQNGKRQSWEAIVKIPFIDEERMMKAVEQIAEEELTESEKRRDKEGTVKEFSFE